MTVKISPKSAPKPTPRRPLVVSQRDQLTSDSDSAVGPTRNFTLVSSKANLKAGPSAVKFERSTDLSFKISDPT